MLRGLWKLTWLELKIFLREPLGVIGSIFVPVVVFFVLGRMGGAAHGEAARRRRAGSSDHGGALHLA